MMSTAHYCCSYMVTFILTFLEPISVHKQKRSVYFIIKMCQICIKIRYTEPVAYMKYRSAERQKLGFSIKNAENLLLNK